MSKFSSGQKRIYRDWHDRDERWEEDIPVNWARSYGRVGIVTSIVYWSDKWDDPSDYVHDFKTPSSIFIAGADGRRLTSNLPNTVVWLGDCLEINYVDEDGEDANMSFGRKRAPMVSIGSNRIAIIDRKAKVVPVVCTGLRVTPEGLRDKDDFST